MTFDILTLFPGFFLSPLNEGIIRRGIEAGFVRARIFNLRSFTTDRHRTVDDRPYGGGAGMVLKPEPIWRAVSWLKKIPGAVPRTILLTPQGQPLRQERIKALSQYQRLLIIAGRYEGVDERIGDHLCDEQISIGDYVLSGGEIAALVLMDGIIRLIPQVMGSEVSGVEESFEESLLEYPQYTRPSTFRGYPVPKVLLSGDHHRIRSWRRREALMRTWKRRPDLIRWEKLNPEEQGFLKSEDKS
jgi:tRNA (guanine37-N1)-methyltransferase